MTYAEDGRRFGNSRLVYNKATRSIDTMKNEADPHSSLEDKIAWAILQALHVNVPEGERPMAWADMSETQEKRVRAAASATMLTIANAGFIKAVEEIGRERLRERLQAVMNDHGIAVGKKDTLDDLLQELEDWSGLWKRGG